MKISLKAFLASLSISLIFTYAFVRWSQSTKPVQAMSRLEFVDQLETQGLPKLEMTDISGRKFSSEQLLGKVVVLNFWASWCSPCLEEFPSMLELFSKFEKEVIVLAISQDSGREDIDAFLKAFKGFEREGVHIVHDQDMKLGEIFKVDRLPESFIFGNNGKLVKKIVGSINWYSPESVEYIQSLVNAK